MNSKQRRTLEAIFLNPVSATIRWADIEALLVSLGCTIVEGKGSHVQFELGGTILTAARPHPGKEAKPYAVRDVRKFLTESGVAP